MSTAAASKARRVRKTQPYHHGDLHSELVRLGRAWLEDAGQGEISLAQLARQAGVSDAAPFRHFETKEALLAEIATEGFEELVKGLTVIAALDAGPREKVGRMLRHYVAYGRANHGLFGLMFGPRILELNRYPALQKAGGEAFGLFAGAVAAFGLEHGWQPKQLALLTHGAWAMEHGVTTLVISRRAPNRTSGVEADEMIHFSIDMALAAIAAGPPPAPAPARHRQRPRARRSAT